MAARQTRRADVENRMIKRREKEFMYDQLWNGQRKYYEKYETNNVKFDSWTSPRYYETNNKLIEKVKKDKEHEENLSKRREKLRKLLREEDKLYQVEIMVRKDQKFRSVDPPRDNIVPVEVLKELNRGLKVEEEDRRRREAELKLYSQWKKNNPFVRHYERTQSNRNLKLSWLDQQVESRMRKEEEEKECKRLLEEREKMLKLEEEKMETEKSLMKVKREGLKADLEGQIEEFRIKNDASEELKRSEERESRRIAELDKIETQRIEDERRRKERECAVFNIKQHKMKLKKKAENIQINLDEERQLINKIRDLEIVDSVENEMKKIEIKKTVNEFLALNEEQRRLEKVRQRQLGFLFDSEAKAQYEQQDLTWKQEESARSQLLKNVIDGIKEQINSNLEKNRQKQLETLQVRETMLKRIEDYNQEINGLKEEEIRKQCERKRIIDQELKLKEMNKKSKENTELKRVNEELERVRKEEERIKQEIINLQRRQGPIRPTRSRLFF